jgi:hypothetical protein
MLNSRRNLQYNSLNSPKNLGTGAIAPVAEDFAKRYVSYLRYTAMGLLLVNRQWPWVLPEGTHYDMYIALDVLNHTAAFTFFSQGGRQCYVETVESRQRGKPEDTHLFATGGKPEEGNQKTPIFSPPEGNQKTLIFSPPGLDRHRPTS